MISSDVMPMSRTSLRTESAQRFIDETRRCLPYLDLRPDLGPFRARIDTHEMPGTSAARIACTPLEVCFAARDVEKDVFKLVWQLRGCGEMVQGAGRFLLKPGQVALYRLSTPYKLRTVGDYRILMLSFDLSEMPERLRLAEHFAGVPIRASTAFRAAEAVINTLFSVAVDDTYASVIEHVLDLIFGSLLEVIRTESLAKFEYSERLEKAREATFASIADPGFAPEDLARALGISRRSLYMEFQRHGIVSPATFIRNFRLEKCHEALLAPAFRRCSITQIAYQYGFSDSAYFSRAFRAKYGVTPSALRHLGESALAAKL